MQILPGSSSDLRLISVGADLQYGSQQDDSRTWREPNGGVFGQQQAIPLQFARCPFQLQSWHLIRCKPYRLRRLRAAVVEVRAPPAPQLFHCGRLRPSANVSGRLTHSTELSWLAAESGIARNSAGDKEGDRLEFVMSPAFGHGCHAARRDDSENVLKRHQLQRAAAGHPTLLVECARRQDSARYHGAHAGCRIRRLDYDGTDRCDATLYHDGGYAAKRSREKQNL
jgi:hypothetical protein